MRTLISTFMKKVFDDFCTEIDGKCLCELKQSRYDGRKIPDYSLLMEQQYYLLRYFPAYLCEYKYIYRKIISDDKIEVFSVLAIGCGSGIDYLGLYLALNKNTESITYRGYDLIDWNYQDNLGNANYTTSVQNISHIEFENPCDVNIIIFPKSLSEINQADFDHFISNLTRVSFSSPYIYLVSSTMDSGFKHDERRYDTILNTLKDNGYNCIDYSPTLVIRDKPAYVKVDNEFKYPDDIISYLGELHEKCPTYGERGQNCESTCEDQLSRKPILTSKYFSYQINRLEK